MQTIDKALLDALLCGEDAHTRVAALTSEVFRVTKPGGRYVVLSHGAPASRVPLLSAAGWEGVAVTEVPKPPLEGFKEVVAASPSYYLYVATKSAAATTGAGR